MPYRRLPKTDSSRLRSLKTLLENNEIYTVREHFIDWKDINAARTAYDRLLTAVEQYRVNRNAQVRSVERIVKLQRTATMYLSHFMQVLKMSVERGEIKRATLQLYSLPDDITVLPTVHTIAALTEWAPKIVAGEKARIKQGGRPIFNPTIGMVQTHADIFAEAYRKQRTLQQRTLESEQRLKEIRPDTDALILRLWDQIEQHFLADTVAGRVDDCRRFGVIYYYRRKEKEQAAAAEAQNEETPQ